MVIYYCRNCGWQSDPNDRGARVNRCDDCRRWGLQFVSYDSAREFLAADRILAAAYKNRRVKESAG